MKTLSLSKKQRGQGMTEYIIIVALIAIAAIGVYSFFGGTIRSQTAGMAAEMAGGQAKDQQAQAKDNAKSAADSAKDQKTLGNYGNQQKQ